MGGLGGRSILVTGAAGGIGGAIVHRLVSEGAHVVASDRDLDSLSRISAETGATPLEFELTSETSVRDAMAHLDDLGVELTGLVNCAGSGGAVEPVGDVDVDVFDQVMSVNARGTLLTIKHAARGMIAHGRGGSIVNISSQAALVSLAGHAAYGASKAAVDAITRVAALELGPYGIRVNSVNPTAVLTPMSASYWSRPEIGEPFLSQMPLGRWATEDDIAGPVAFLLGDDAAMITGVTLQVEGG